MGIGKDGYYHLYDIAAYNPNFALLLSGRNAGKSYAIYMDEEKNGYGGYLKKAFDTGKPIIGYIRRRKEDIVAYLVEDDFQDKLKAIEKMTNGQYNAVSVQKGKIHFAYVDEDNNKKIGTPFAYIFNLSTEGRYKSRQYPTVEVAIFEEFVDTDGRYLQDEVRHLQSLRSTIFRDREGVTYLIGNTISRENPYFEEWQLIGIPKMKVGQIDTYNMETSDDGVIKLCVELAPNRGDKSKMFFGKASKSIASSTWDTKEYPHLTGNYLEDYDCCYSMLWKKTLFSFIIDLLVEKESGQMLVYIRPASPKRDYKMIVHIESWNDNNDIYYSTPFLRREIYAEEMIAKLIAQKKVCYSTNLTGEDFNVSMKNDLEKPFLLR